MTKKTKATFKAETKKIYKLPDDVHDQFMRVDSLRSLRDTFVRLSPFGAYKLASRASHDAEKANQKAWEMVRKIYPETANKPMTYNPVRKELREGQGE